MWAGQGKAAMSAEVGPLIEFWSVLAGGVVNHADSFPEWRLGVENTMTATVPETRPLVPLQEERPLLRCSGLKPTRLAQACLDRR